MGGRVWLFAAALCLAVPAPSRAQDALSGSPLQSTTALPSPSLTLPAGVPVIVVLDQDLSSKTSKVGDRFEVVVLYDVVDHGIVVIPQGTIGYGEVTFSTDKGGFGKGGILGIALRHLDLGGRMVALDGRYREEGRNNDGAAAATMFAVGIFAAAVKGKSSIIPKGRQLKARTGEDIVFAADRAAEPSIDPLSATD